MGLKILNQKEYWIGLGLVFIIGMAIVTLATDGPADHSSMDMTSRRELLLSEKDSMVKDLIADGKYKCCLAKPCTTCLISNLENEDESENEGNIVCNCLEHVVTGKAPCNECIGGILKGDGNPFLAEYFADALADEFGEENKETLQTIIEEKYYSPEGELL